MCHIIHCVTLFLDLIQRLITYFFACFIFVVVYIALTAALIAGMTYGYKYYLAEYYTINSTLHAIRKISMDPMRSELAEFDTKHYKSLIDYYEHMATSTEEETKADALRKIFNPTGLPQLVENKLLLDEMDRATVDSKEDKERATVVFDYLDTPDVNEYVKKIYWIESKENETTATVTEKAVTKFALSLTNEIGETVHVKVTTRHWEPVTTKYWEPVSTRDWVPVTTKHWDPETTRRWILEPTKKVLKTKSTSKRLSEYADRPLLRYLMPVNKMAATSTTKKGSGFKFYIDKLKSALAHDNVMRRTVEPQILNTTNAASTSDSKALSILLKHLTAVTRATTTAVIPNKTSAEEASFNNPSTPRIKEYERKLNLALSQRDDKTRDEKIVIV